MSGFSSTWYLFTPDHRLLPGVDVGLGARGRLLDTHLGNAVADRLGHTAVCSDLGDVSAARLASSWVSRST